MSDLKMNGRKIINFAKASWGIGVLFALLVYMTAAPFVLAVANIVEYSATGRWPGWGYQIAFQHIASTGSEMSAVDIVWLLSLWLLATLVFGSTVLMKHERGEWR
jgi:hypothetical protein